MAKVITLLIFMLFVLGCHNSSTKLETGSSAGSSSSSNFIFINTDNLSDTVLAYVNNQDYDKATEYLKKVIELKPDFAEAYSFMGLISITKYSIDKKKENYYKATEYFKKAIELEQNDTLLSRLYDILGEVYFREKDYDGAIEYFKKTIELKQNDTLVYKMYRILGNAYDYKNDYDNAIEHYEKAIELKPDYASIYADIGRIYYYKNDYDNAIKHYEKAIDFLEATSLPKKFFLGTTYRYMSEAYEAKGDKEKELEYKNKAKRLGY
jgi:tetratricopeptide (TPR) repeat protein